MDPAPEVLVAFASPAALADPDRRAAALALLDAEERARMARFHFDRDRDLYLATHALVRRTLSRLAPADPRAWTFSAGAHGRPQVTGPDAALRFSASHTHGLAMAAVARGVEVGADAEELRDPPPLDVAGQLSPAEQRALAAAPAERRALTFYALWTLKEAYVKARGLGLALRLDGFTVSLDGGAPMLEVSADGDERAGHWQLQLLHPSDHHVAALCLCPGAAATVLRDELV